MLNKRHASRNKESKSFTKSLRGSLRGTLEAETMEGEAASEEEAEDEVSEADASECSTKMICVAVLRTSVALEVWHLTMGCIYLNLFLLEDSVVELRSC
jgi:hypothetical protein